MNAGIPVAVDGVRSLSLIAEKNNLGRHIDLEGDIMMQMKEIARIKIPLGILEEKGFTFDSKTSELIKFYKTVSTYTQKGV